MEIAIFALCCVGGYVIGMPIGRGVEAYLDARRYAKYRRYAQR